MLSRLDLRGRALNAVELPRPQVAGDPPVAAVRSIIADVRARGDAAVRELTDRLDRQTSPIGALRVAPEECRR